MVSPALAECATPIYRVARSRRLLEPARITPADAENRNGGNRFDVPGGGVTYLGSTPMACLAETLARFRPSPGIKEAVGHSDEGFMNTGSVPRDWRLQRSLAVVDLVDPLPFFDLEHPDTHAYLDEELADDLLALGYRDHLDVSDLLNDDRRLSRAIALHAYTAVDEVDYPLYAGIKYSSRLDSSCVCWAIFEGTEMVVVEKRSIEPSMDEVVELSRRWSITVH